MSDKIITTVLIIASLVLWVTNRATRKERTHAFVERYINEQEQQHHPTADTWKRYTVAGISIESPYGFDSGRNDMPLLPPDVQKIARRFETFNAVNTPKNLEVAINSMVCDPHVTLDLDAGIAGAIKAGAAKLGDNDPKYTVTFAGPNTKIVSYRSSEGNLGAAMIVQANKAWTVLAYYNNTQYTATAQRILHSVKRIE